MNAVNPTRFIAQHGCSYYGPLNADRISYCLCGWSGEDHSAHVVSELSDAGYSIVPAVPALNAPIKECIQEFINGWAMGDGELAAIIDSRYFAEGLSDLIADQLPDLIRAAAVQKRHGEAKEWHDDPLMPDNLEAAYEQTAAAEGEEP